MIFILCSLKKRVRCTCEGPCNVRVNVPNGKPVTCLLRSLDPRCFYEHIISWFICHMIWHMIWHSITCTFRKLRQGSCFCLASASGVMAYVSLVEVFQEGKASFKDAFDIMAKEHVEHEGMILSRTLFRWGTVERTEGLIDPALSPQTRSQFNPENSWNKFIRKMKLNFINFGVEWMAKHYL